MTHQISHLNLEQKTVLKKMMNKEGHAMLIVKSNSKLQCYNLVYVITVMNTSLLREK